MSNKFTLEEIKNYIKSQDSLGDVLYNLTEDNICKANRTSFVEEFECLLEDFDIKKANKFTMTIHEFEAKGGNLTPEEEFLWEKLTVKIQQSYL